MKPRNDVKVTELPLNTIQRGVNYVIMSNHINYITHSIHKYPAKFIPHIPRWAIQTYLGGGRRGLVLDPFSGSGTTLLEAAVSGHSSIGVDIDPLSRLIAKVKLTPLDTGRLHGVFQEIERGISKRKKGKFQPATSNLYHWFSRRNANDLSVLRDVIEKYKNEKDVYDFLIVTLSSIIRKVSNADDQSHKTYVSHTYPKTPPNVFITFRRALKEHIVQMEELSRYYGTTKPQFRLPNGVSATNFGDSVRKSSVDLAITSPPYIKAIDYIYNQMVELFWIGDLFDLDTQAKQNTYKRLYIGTKILYKSQYEKIPVTGYNFVDRLVRRIKKKDLKHAFIVADYFVKMKDNICATNYVLKPRGHYIVVIGNCKVSGVEIPISEFLAKISEENNFTVHNFFSYTIRNRYMRFSRSGKGGLITHDWVIDLIKK